MLAIGNCVFLRNGVVPGSVWHDGDGVGIHGEQVRPAARSSAGNGSHGNKWRHLRPMKPAHRPPSRQPQLTIQVQERGPIANHFLATPAATWLLVAIPALAVEGDADLRGVRSTGKSERLPTRLAGAVDQFTCRRGDGAASVPKSRAASASTTAWMSETLLFSPGAWLRRSVKKSRSFWEYSVPLVIPCPVKTIVASYNGS